MKAPGCYKNRNLRYKNIASYLFLYMAFIGIFYDFAYNAWVCVKPISLMLVIFQSLLFWIVYVIINHTLIKRYVKTSALFILESILLLTIFTLLTCYGALWNL